MSEESLVVLKSISINEEKPKNKQNNDKDDKKVSSSKHKQSKKRIKTKKASDPDVKIISNMISNNLLIKSPDKPFKQDTEINCEDNSEINSSSDDFVRTTPPVKINAFQFMMNNRHKVIGSNSPGKERKESDTINTETVENKTKLSKRKAIFEDWSEKKGSLKRKKIADEAQEKYIAKTLKKRAKRMKEMLNISDDNNVEEEIINRPMNKKRKAIVIESGSSNDSIDLKLNNSNKQNDGENSEITSDNCNNTEDVLPVTNLNKTIKSSKSESSENNNKINKKKSKKEQKSKNKSRLSLKKSEDLKRNICSPKKQSNMEENNPNETKENICKSNEIKENVCKLNETKDNKSESNNDKIGEFNEDKNEVKLLKTDNNLNDNKTKHVKNAEEIEDNSDEIFSNQKSKTPNRLRQTKLINNVDEEKNDKIDLEMENRNVFSPRAWKMRVRLFEKENVDENEDKESSNDENEEIILSEDERAGKLGNKKLKSIENSMNTNININTKKQVKLAPLFLRTPKKDKTAAEAKKSFLLSGMPSQMKKILTKQSTQEIMINYELFPKISHVQQKSLESFWNLPDASIKLSENDSSNSNLQNYYSTIEYGTFTNCNSVNINQKINSLNKSYKPPSKLNNIKELITQLKLENQTYPIYKSFRLLFEKSEKQFTTSLSQEEKPIEVLSSNETKKKRGRPKKKQIKEEVLVKKIEISASKMCMWSEKYKPKSSGDILGNSNATQELKSWLQSWVVYSEDQKNSKRRKRTNSDSSGDFCSDSDTRDTDSSPCNTVLLIGPFGSGKSSTVYALSNELNINVIEINASSKRPGKRILSELQEATQSHQVKNADSTSFNNFFQKKSDTLVVQKTEEDLNKKLSLLLVEDIDIVFDDQDDGFISSLVTLASSSKRPIVLTTSDKMCNQIQKLSFQYTVINFVPLSSRILGPWMQILCLVEGVRISKKSVERLLDWNKGDMRKTLLQLQFWTETGGDPKLLDSISDSNQNKIEKNSGKFDDEIKIDKDESSNLSWLQVEENSISRTEKSEIFHENCFKCFIPYYQKDSEVFQISYPLDLNTLWWNMPKILNYKNPVRKIIYKAEENTSNNQINNGNIVFENDDDIFPTLKKNEAEINAEISTDEKSTDQILINETNDKSETIDDDSHSGNNCYKIDLNHVANLMETLAFADTLIGKNDFNCEFDYWQKPLTDSLSLTENISYYNASEELSNEIGHYLVENNLKKIDFQRNFNININAPRSSEIRWRTKQHKSMNDVLSVVPSSSILDRKAICEDYQSVLRSICRIEQSRFATNNKRKNRFYHYLRNYNIHLTESTYLILCNTLAMNHS